MNKLSTEAIPIVKFADFLGISDDFYKQANKTICLFV